MSLTRFWIASAALGTAMLVGGVPGASAQEFPEDTVEVTELFGAGSSSDLTARVLAEGLSKQLEVPVVVVNRPGGGGAIGYSYLKEQSPDGYKLVWMSDSILTNYHSGNMDFDRAAFTPVARVCEEVPALAVRADAGWEDLDGFLQAAKEQPGQLKVGISGKGAFTHLASEALFKKAGVEARYVPYGKGNAAVELLGGRIDAALQWPSVFQSHVDAGNLRMLAVTSADRLETLQDVPSAHEQGVGVDLVLWRGLAAPAETPPEVVDTLAQAVEQVVSSEQFQEAAQRIGCQPAYMPAEEFAGFISEKDEEITALMEELEIKQQ